jgi:hypothetical protein
MSGNYDELHKKMTARNEFYTKRQEELNVSEQEFAENEKLRSEIDLEFDIFWNEQLKSKS